jgi:hypothetical protein
VCAAEQARVTSLQSMVVLHCTQEPLPSQTLPPLSEQAVACAALAVPQTFAMQVSSLQVVVWVGQSLADWHCTHPSTASHTWPVAAQLIGVDEQEPEPLQSPPGVKTAPAHPAVAHDVVAAACSQTPPVVHLPSLPHVVVTAH